MATTWKEVKEAKRRKRYESFKAAHPEATDDLYRFLTALRRSIAKDGPHQRPEGALEAFDEACNSLGVPFIEP